MVKIFQEATRVKVLSDNLDDLKEARKDKENKFFAKSPIYHFNNKVDVNYVTDSEDGHIIDIERNITPVFAFNAMTLPAETAVEVESSEEEQG